MIRLLFVGDGPRDEAMTPVLVRRLLRDKARSHDDGFRAWARINAVGKGYDRKLMFALRQARDGDYHGVVATIDRDASRGRERFKSLVAGRARDREMQPPLPTALGCADPHAEAWLLDDPVAVRDVLGLPPAQEIPDVVRETDPKQALCELQAKSARAHDAPALICGEIAARLELSRCAHRRETGLQAFASDVEDELGPLRTRVS